MRLALSLRSSIALDVSLVAGEVRLENADLADSLSGKPGISVCTGVPIDFFLNKWIKTETETAAIS